MGHLLSGSDDAQICLWNINATPENKTLDAMQIFKMEENIYHDEDDLPGDDSIKETSDTALFNAVWVDRWSQEFGEAGSLPAFHRLGLDSSKKRVKSPYKMLHHPNFLSLKSPVQSKQNLLIYSGNGKRNQGKTRDCFTTVQINPIPSASYQSNQGCRAYMCGTSFRYSNCLDQYKKAYTKVTPSDTHPLGYESLDSQAMSPLSNRSVENCEFMELACPLCRGQVKGWTVFEPAREHLNAKKRSCMQDSCSFIGTYKELRKHVRVEHASAKPREVDPILEQKWRRLERERETQDVMSTISSSVPGAVFFGDYVIEGRHYGFNSSEEEHYHADGMEQDEGSEVGIDHNLMRVFLFFQAFGSAGSSRSRERDSDHTLDRGASDYFDQDDDDYFSVDDGNSNTSLTGRLRRRGRVHLRRNRREANGN
ncbi:unnamed protein product [Fraxinus pennsylvanica]|uniref:Uncharacterized protein n=1 Tax=Fraxinus pennsylvanica TaxID=56036 RepID=A0AAD1Z977_9LAMI|nr:unnamed protein product [Fraxinus pennsylvanica]